MPNPVVTDVEPFEKPAYSQHSPYDLDPTVNGQNHVAYHNAQLKVASCCMRSVASGVVREASIQELIADFEKKKTAAAAHFVNVASR
jgi:hypothetical protein